MDICLLWVVSLVRNLQWVPLVSCSEIACPQTGLPVPTWLGLVSCLPLSLFLFVCPVLWPDWASALSDLGPCPAPGIPSSSLRAVPDHGASQGSARLERLLPALWRTSLLMAPRLHLSWQRFAWMFSLSLGHKSDSRASLCDFYVPRRHRVDRPIPRVTRLEDVLIIPLLPSFL